MRRLKIAVIAVLAAAPVIAYLAYASLTDPVVICMRGDAGIGSGVLVNAEMNMNPGKGSGNLTLTLKDHTCAYISGVEVTSMRPSVVASGIPRPENLSYPSLITNASFVNHNGVLVSSENRVPIGGSAIGSLGVNGVEVGTSYTMDIVISYSGQSGVGYTYVTAEVTAS